MIPATFRWAEVEIIKLRPEIHEDGNERDIALADAITGAVEAYEEFTNNILCLSTWDLYLDKFPTRIDTPGPLSSITSITYLDSAGASQTLATTYYKIDISDPAGGRITLKNGQTWPSTYSEADAVVVRLMAGWADPNSIPERVKQGLVLSIQESLDGIDRSASYEACWRRYRRIPV